MGEGALGRVRVIGLPLDVARRATEHGEALRRELAFVAHAADPEGAPARLYLLGVELGERYSGLTDAQDERIAQAVAAGATSIDVEYDLPVEVADACEKLGALYEELDDFCRDGDLLTLVTPPEGLALRRWFLGEFIGQLRDGAEPRPWSPSLVRELGGEPAVPVVPAPAAAADAAAATASAGDAIVVTEDLDLALAPALREEIVSRTDTGAEHVTVDLSQCEFMDSTGLSLLLTTHLRLASGGGALHIVGARGQVAGVIEMSGVTDLLLFDPGPAS